MKSKRTQEQVRAAFHDVFLHYAPGQIVLDELERVARSGRIDRDNINPANAVYRVAQLDLIQFIRNLMETEDDNRIIASNRADDNRRRAQ
jgi:hypothetical protein